MSSDFCLLQFDCKHSFQLPKQNLLQFTNSGLPVRLQDHFPHVDISVGPKYELQKLMYPQNEIFLMLCWREDVAKFEFLSLVRVWEIFVSCLELNVSLVSLLPKQNPCSDWDLLDCFRSFKHSKQVRKLVHWMRVVLLTVTGLNDDFGTREVISHCHSIIEKLQLRGTGNVTSQLLSSDSCFLEAEAIVAMREYLQQKQSRQTCASALARSDDRDVTPHCKTKSHAWACLVSYLLRIQKASSRLELPARLGRDENMLASA